MSRINADFRALFIPGMVPAQPVQDMWLVETHDDYVIASISAQYFRVGMTETNGGVTFEPREKWIEVVRRTEWDAAKAAARLKSPDT
jgi:hypothetical protein